MKASKSPENSEVTPSKKKLKQARLPFKIISEASSSPVSPVTPSSRKRKLSATEAETIAKAGKISKENDIVDLVVLSDDDSRDEQTNETNKLPNPYVKLVDAAWKKKIQKAKAGRKKRGTRKSLSNSEKVTRNVSIDKNAAADTTGNVPEGMEVDEPAVEQEKGTPEPEINQNKTATNSVSKIEVSDIVDLDSNSCDVQEISSTPENSQKHKTKPNSNDDNSKSSTNSLGTPNSLSDNVESSNTELSHHYEFKKNDTNVENSIKQGNNSNNTNHSETELSQSDKEDLSHKNESNNEENSEQSAANSDSEMSHSEKEDSNETDKKTAVDEQLPVTPKRSLRNQSKGEENNNKGSPSSKLNNSSISNPTTPKQSRNSSVNNHDESLNESISSNANLTPRQLQKRAESAKKREEKEKERLERQKKKLQEKEEREKQKQEKEEQKKKEREEREEAKRKEREEKEEQRKKEKEEKEKQKDLEKKLREEKEEQKKKEKEEKEDQKRKEKEAREEEKRKKAEAAELEKQEQELKKKKAAEAFLNFFVPKQKIEGEKQATVGAVTNNMLSNFTIKSDMRLAPTIRVNLTEEKAKQLEKYIKEQNVEEADLYLKSLKNGCKPLSSGKTWPLSDREDDDVILVENELPPLDGALESVTCEPVIREKLHPKLFSFHDNRRPPYWGTWRKKSAVVKPRRPFGQDEKQLDYEVDSDEEWEEEQEGESIDGSAAGSDDDMGPDEYEVDNEVFVPHGYLSDEEATMDEDDVLTLSPETQKARLKHLEDEFESEMKKPTEKLKPRLYGLFWETKDGGKPENCADAIWNYFEKLSFIMNDPTPFLQPSTDQEDQEKRKVKKKKVLPEGETLNSEKKKDKRKKVEEKNKTVQESKKVAQEVKKNQPGINTFLAKIKPSS